MKRRLSHVIFLAAAIFGTTQLSSGQSTPLSEQQYWAEIRSAYSATRKAYPRRETESYESFSNGASAYTRIEVSEYLSSNTYRITKIVTQNGRDSFSQVIQLGTTRYCREDPGGWKSVGCYQQPPAPLGDAHETDYSLEIKKKSKILTRLAKSKQMEKGKPEPTKYVTEDRLVINIDSTIKERIIKRLKGDSKTVVSVELTKIDYNAKIIAIEAPIK